MPCLEVYFLVGMSRLGEIGVRRGLDKVLHRGDDRNSPIESRVADQEDLLMLAASCPGFENHETWGSRFRAGACRSRPGPALPFWVPRVFDFPSITTKKGAPFLRPLQAWDAMLFAHCCWASRIVSTSRYCGRVRFLPFAKCAKDEAPRQSPSNPSGAKARSFLRSLRHD